MIEENYNFTYKISNINIETGTFEIMYTPESEYLTPVTLNQFLLIRPFDNIVDPDGNLIYSSQEEVPFSVHLENTVNLTKPVIQWQRQYMMLNNIEELKNSTGSMTVDITTVAPQQH